MGAIFPISGVLSAKFYTSVPILTTYVPSYFLVNQSYWAASQLVPTSNIGTSQIFTLPVGANVTMTLTALASQDPGVAPAEPMNVAAIRLFALSESYLSDLRSNHVHWWNSFWAKSSVTLDAAELATERFYYGSLYVLGSSTREGQLMMDIWSPFRTTDYSEWRSNPTMDYNTQAAYSGIFTANHVELAQPYYDFVASQLSGNSPTFEAQALNCSGYHFSVDLVHWGMKLGIYGIPQDWSILSNAAYMAVTYSYHFYSVPVNSTWITTFALPFLSGVSDFWMCKLTKVQVGAGYEYWDDANDCNGDEGCGLTPRINPMWTVVYLKRLFQTVIDMALAIGVPPDPMWIEYLSHLPPIPTTTKVINNVTLPILAWYGANNSYLHTPGGQANNLHAIWPGELISMSEADPELLEAAQVAVNQTAWTQANSFSWVYSSAARVGLPLTTVFTHWHNALNMSAMKTNFLYSYSGLCSDALGIIQFVHDMMMQSQEGFVRLFPSWPGHLNASFTNFRARQAILVSSSYIGNPSDVYVPAGITGGTVNVTFYTETNTTVTVLNPWPSLQSSDIIVCDYISPTVCNSIALSFSTVGGLNGGTLFSWVSTENHTYTVSHL
jgi:hypothetical protein